MIYLTHIIQQGETLQQIATERLHDVSRWTELQSLNHLDFPYIVDSPKEKERLLRQTPPVHVLTSGDEIKLPVNNTPGNRLNADTTDLDQANIYDSVLGMDLELGFNDGDSAGSNYGDQYAFLRANKNGTDIAVARGARNLVQSLVLRLTTKQGELPMHPLYGSRLHNWIGQPITNSSYGSTCQDISNEILRTVNTDTRVKDSKINKCILSDENFFAIVTVTPLSPFHAFNLFVSSVNGNQIIANQVK